MKAANEKTTFHGPLAGAARIPDEEWAYFEYLDDLVEQIFLLMDRMGVTQSELARRLDSSPPWVSKLLSGDAHNMTIKTFVKVLHALEAHPETRVVGKDESVQWFHVHENMQRQAYALDPGFKAAPQGTKSKRLDFPLAA